MWKVLIDDEIAARLERLDVPFNRYGLDPYGISREHVAGLISWLGWMYRHYFRVQTHGAAHIPAAGPGLLIGNHSGGIPVDAGMVLASLVLELDPPRLGHAMVEKFANSLPFLSQYYSRFGQFTGLPEHATRFLREGRLVVVFPEGVRGIGKYYSQRYQLERFGTGFMRIALAGKAPIIPFAFVGGEESYPVTFKLDGLGKLLGAPFIPIPRHLVPVPLPVMCHLVYGEPMWFDGTGDEADEVIVEYVRQVQERVAGLIEQGRELRRASMTAAPPQAEDMP